MMMMMMVKWTLCMEVSPLKIYLNNSNTLMMVTMTMMTQSSRTRDLYMNLSMKLLFLPGSLHACCTSYRWSPLSQLTGCSFVSWEMVLVLYDQHQLFDKGLLLHRSMCQVFEFPICVRATPPVLNMWPCKSKLDEEKSKHAGLAQQNGFGWAFLHSLLRLVKGTAKLNTWQRRL